MANSQLVLKNEKIIEYSLKYRYFCVFLSLFILPLSGFAIDIYVPSLPAISLAFGVNASLAQLTVTAYMVGLGLMQFIAGPISDTYGRRNPYLFSMVFFILTTLAIPFSTSIYFLLLMRFLQGLMVALMVVPLRSVISDLFEGPEFMKMVNYMTLAWSIGPIIAPVIGGYFQHYLGWKSNFYFLSIYSSISLILNYLFLPDTSQYHFEFNIRDIFTRYVTILSNKTFFIGILMNGLIYSIIILFAIVAPFLIQSILHYSAIQFGHVVLITGFAWFLGGVIGRFSMHMCYNLKSKFAIASMLVITTAALILDLLLPLNLFLIVIPVILLELVTGLIFSHNFARGVSQFPRYSGTANAIFSAFTFFISGIASFVGSLLKTNSVLPLTISYLFIVLALLLLYKLSRFLKTC